MALERLQKVMAEAGVASRRHAEEMIAAGQVMVNGEVVTEMGVKVDPERDRIEVDGKPLTPEAKVYLALNKPAGVVTTAEDTHDRPTVLSLIPEAVGRVYPVGRLDMDSQGLLLLTNDGDLAYRLTHPGFEHEKEYKIRVAGHPSEKLLAQLARGIALEDGPTLPAQISMVQKKRDSTWLRVVLREGRKRQLRRMFEAIDHPVRDLIRMRVGPIQLGDLPPGEWRRLSAREVQALRRLAAGENVDVVRAPSSSGRGAARAVGIATAGAAAAAARTTGQPHRPDDRSVPGGRGRRINDAPPRHGDRPGGGGPRRGRDEESPRPPRPNAERRPRPDDDDDWWMRDEDTPRRASGGTRPAARGGSGRPASGGGRPSPGGGGRPASGGGRPSLGGGGRPTSGSGRSASGGGRPPGGSQSSGGGGGRPASGSGRPASGGGRPTSGGGGRSASGGGRPPGGSQSSGGGGGRPTSGGSRPPSSSGRSASGGSRSSGGGGSRPTSSGSRPPTSRPPHKGGSKRGGPKR